MGTSDIIVNITYYNILMKNIVKYEKRKMI